MILKRYIANVVGTMAEEKERCANSRTQFRSVGKRGYHWAGRVVLPIVCEGQRDMYVA
ncbi:hypothetical protein HNQ41_000592 [Texcoconibacillus texcoconensis]|uniref:Uncharacterized protein n=1 Tax=Texcoconibacillus texcoconensis TaxID=1095777 RepID=A0A840QM52_9BACI|nr:hypothetical protein [Texcoconibacillus texcoconensis]